MSKFNAFNLSKDLIENLNKLGYVDATPIQASVIPKALVGSSLVCKSETGSGKTHSFIIPILEKIDFSLNKLQAIIISPTRELAKQTYDFIKEFNPYYKTLSVKLISSSNDINKDINSISNEPQIIVATCGRISDLLTEKSLITLSYVNTIVLDEADMLLESGFIDDVDKILSICTKAQILVFSATISKSLQFILEKYIKSDFFITSDNTGNTSSNVKHHAIDVKHMTIEESIKKFLIAKPSYFLLIFVSKKEDINKIYECVSALKYKVAFFHGDLSVRERKSIMKRIKNDEFQIVICSDIASRGIDLPTVDSILSVDLPNNIEFYYHRAGRTGRYDRQGDSYIFYNVDNQKNLNKLMNEGLKLDFFKFNEDELVETKPINYKKTFKTKKNNELDRKINITKAKMKTKNVKPGYKKKLKEEISKVIRKHKRLVIKKNIRRQREERYKENAKKREI